MQWIFLQSYSFPYEAQIAKAQLDSVGISSYLENEHTINMYWLYSNALGGVRLFVLESEYNEARKILETDFSLDVDDKFPDSKIYCPSCNSSTIYAYTKAKKVAYILFLILDFPLANYEHGYRCYNCEYFFK